MIQARYMVGRADRDLAAIRTDSHEMFPDGYPSVELEPVDELYEGQEIATCGFPLGTFLSDR